MRKVLALAVALGLLIVSGGTVLAGDFGMCSYSSHVNQAATDKATVSKTAATRTTPKPDAVKLLLAQTDKAAKSAPGTKK